MAARRVSIRCGDRLLPLRLPRAWRVTLLEPARDHDGRRLPAREAIERALDGPLDAPPLEDLARSARSAVIAVTDLTRPCPDDLLVPAIVRRLMRAGMRRRSIRVVVATGMHRALDRTELSRKLGPSVIEDLPVESHDARRERGLASLGTGPMGVPIGVNRAAAEADLVVATGVVEPHLYAGFSGGAKTLAIGCGPEETIAATHSPAFLDMEGVALGRIADNPFQDLVREAALRARLAFVVNVVTGHSRGIVAAAAGSPSAVLERLARVARRRTFAPVRGPFDLVIAGAGTPKDVNLYQASRLPTYLALGCPGVLAPGAAIVVAARCPEGAGRGLGEARFARALSAGPPAEVLDELRHRRLAAGEQRAYMVARVLARHRVLWAGLEGVVDVEAMGMVSLRELSASVAESGLDPLGPARVLVIPDGFERLPADAARRPM